MADGSPSTVERGLSSSSLAMFDDAFATATPPELAGAAAASSPQQLSPDPSGALSPTLAAEPADASRTTPSESESPSTSEGIDAPQRQLSGGSMAMFDAMFSPAAAEVSPGAAETGAAETVRTPPQHSASASSSSAASASASTSLPSSSARSSP